jgi:hypothetical protein
VIVCLAVLPLRVGRGRTQGYEAGHGRTDKAGEAVLAAALDGDSLPGVPVVEGHFQFQRLGATSRLIQWGHIHFTSPASDTMLMDYGTTALSYGPTVYVGDQTTNSRRAVAAVDTSWRIGDQVALSGANSGLLVSSVKNPAFKDPEGRADLRTKEHPYRCAG